MPSTTIVSNDGNRQTNSVNAVEETSQRTDSVDPIERVATRKPSASLDNTVAPCVRVGDTIEGQILQQAGGLEVIQPTVEDLLADPRISVPPNDDRPQTRECTARLVGSGL